MTLLARTYLDWRGEYGWYIAWADSTLKLPPGDHALWSLVLGQYLEQRGLSIEQIRVEHPKDCEAFLRDFGAFAGSGRSADSTPDIGAQSDVGA